MTFESRLVSVLAAPPPHNRLESPAWLGCPCVPWTQCSTDQYLVAGRDSALKQDTMQLGKCLCSFQVPLGAGSLSQPEFLSPSPVSPWVGPRSYHIAWWAERPSGPQTHHPMAVHVPSLPQPLPIGSAEDSIVCYRMVLQFSQLSQRCALFSSRDSAFSALSGF